MTTDLNSPVSERDYTLGPDDAPVTIVEYGDYQCADCVKAHSILKRVKERLGSRLRLAYRHMPWAKIHPRAQATAEASLAAGAQGRFWEMHDLLYGAAGQLNDEDLVRYAGQIGLDVERFQRELADGTHKARVLEDQRSAVRSGVKRTPALFINGMRYQGDWQDEESLAARLTELAAQT